jgi:hypothetical protein
MEGRIGDGQVTFQKVQSLPVRDGVTVIPSGPGGDADEALDISAYLSKYSYNALVDETCGSACAQVIFLGANRKIIYKDGAVAMHGAPLTDAQVEALHATAPIKAKIRATQHRLFAFYASRGIDVRITYDFPKPLLDLLAKGQLVFWIPNESDFAKDGVKNLTYCNARFQHNGSSN